MRLAQIIWVAGTAIIGLRFALAAFGVLEVDRFDCGFVAVLMLFMAHVGMTADVSTGDVTDTDD